METNSRKSTEDSLIKYKEGLGLFTQKMPEFARQYNAFTEECFKEGELTQKQKQLIALGISIHAQDEYCIIYHTKGCLDQGCSEQEILEAVEIIVCNCSFVNSMLFTSNLLFYKNRINLMITALPTKNERKIVLP
ncbi:carboxymuconolactone decarboxylase family protein [Calidifontibacillus oryziterrae]|uniref:carboxymuconolactone decarboxylase family protein n=1 Tax=Calidifontibacillus oryziterrae TaxID=1191699 RepID=UPI0002FAC85C|nr:carboxymuconolactone decarboxylase family protein [Calidifontibacillus oryziterrae]